MTDDTFCWRLLKLFAELSDCCLTVFRLPKLPLSIIWRCNCLGWTWRRRSWWRTGSGLPWLGWWWCRWRSDEVHHLPHSTCIWTTKSLPGHRESQFQSGSRSLACLAVLLRAIDSIGKNEEIMRRTVKLEDSSRPVAVLAVLTWVGGAISVHLVVALSVDFRCGIEVLMDNWRCSRYDPLVCRW